MVMARLYACNGTLYAYNEVVVKRTSLNLDLDLVADARSVLSTRGTTETIHRALEDVVRRDRLRALAERTFEDLTPEALVELRRTRA
jgi:Arc/MetJ family transcription regulator